MKPHYEYDYGNEQYNVSQFLAHNSYCCCCRCCCCCFFLGWYWKSLVVVKKSAKKSFYYRWQESLTVDEQLSLTAHNSKGSVKRSRKLNTLQKKKTLNWLPTPKKHIWKTKWYKTRTVIKKKIFARPKGVSLKRNVKLLFFCCCCYFSGKIWPIYPTSILSEADK